MISAYGDNTDQVIGYDEHDDLRWIQFGLEIWSQSYHKLASFFSSRQFVLWNKEYHDKFYGQTNIRIEWKSLIHSHITQVECNPMQIRRCQWMICEYTFSSSWILLTANRSAPCLWRFMSLKFHQRKTLVFFFSHGTWPEERFDSWPSRHKKSLFGGDVWNLLKFAFCCNPFETGHFIIGARHWASKIERADETSM